jgi:hypothetical protein
VAGDIAGQVTGLAIGTQTEYNWKQTVGAGLGGALFGPVASGLTKAFGGAAAVNNSLVRSYTVAAASGFGSGFGGDLATQTLEAAFGDREWRNISVGRSLLVGTLGAVAAPAAKGLQDNLPKQLTNFGSTEWFQTHPRANPFNYRPTVRGLGSTGGNIGVDYVGPEAPNSPQQAPSQAPPAYSIPNYPDVARPGWLEPWTPPPSRPGFRYNKPVNHGRWVNPDGSPGEPSNSLWISTRQSVIDVVGINPATGEANPIVFYRGVVDFSPWTVGQPLRVPGIVGTRVNSNADQGLINRAIAQREGLPSERAVERWLIARELSAHHAGGDTVILLPRGLHATQYGGVQHTNVADLQP